MRVVSVEGNERMAARHREVEKVTDGWCRAELASCASVVERMAEELEESVGAASSCGELVRLEAATLREVVAGLRAREGAFLATRRASSIAGGVERWREAGLVEVAALREAAASWVEAWRPQSPGTPRNDHARRRVVEVAAARVRERGLDGSTACDRRRYVERGAVEVELVVRRQVCHAP